jgi:hypothetical protein
MTPLSWPVILSPAGVASTFLVAWSIARTWNLCLP